VHRLLYVIFFLSGFAGLVYESVWSRYLGLLVGHSAYAQVIVLTAFLGGLALGSLIVAKFSRRVRSPLLWYAGMEFVVGVIGLAFHDVFLATLSLAHESLFPALAGGVALTAVKWGIAGALILPPAVCLGTTFPLMSAALLRHRPGRPGRTLSLLYFTNSLGAALGALTAGFVLVGWVGLPGTVLVAGLVNITVAVAAWGIARRMEATAPPAPSEPENAVASTGSGSLWRLLLAVSFGTALASFIYEIAWIRMLSLVLGSATHSFELMLSAFIFGLAAGSLFIQRRADKAEHPLAALGVIQWLMGISALLTLPLYLHSFEWTAALLMALDSTEAGYTLFNVGRYFVALMVMLPSTFCAGMTLPLITRALVTGGHGEKSVGWVYGINTFGSICGVVLASLLLMPALGLKGLLALGAVLDMALGVWLLARWARETGKGSRTAWVGIGATVVGTATILAVTPFDAAVLNSGVFRNGRTRSAGEVVFWKDGRTASVGVTATEAFRSLSTNGKADASLSNTFRERQDGAPPRALDQDEPTQILLPLITLAYNPGAREAAIIGQGSGISSHVLLGSPVLQEVVTIEIEPAMIEGSRWFMPANRKVFEDPRSRLVIDDAKSYFASSHRSFDLILSEPSNPWVSGVSNLFTAEFYQQVARHLRPGGVFGQWLHLYEMDDGLVLSILAALHSAFPDYALHQVNSADVLIVARNEPELGDPDWSVFQYPDVRTELERTYPFTPDYLNRSRFLGRRSLAPLLDDWRGVNSDYYPILDLGADRARFQGGGARGFLATMGSGFDPSDVLESPKVSNDAGKTPVPVMESFRAMELRGQLAAKRSGVEPDTADGSGPLLRSALYTEAVFQGLLAGDGSEMEWRPWLETLRMVATARAGGIGVGAQDALFDSATAFAVKAGAPSATLVALRFDRALAAADWVGVGDVTLELMPDSADATVLSQLEVPAELLRDAGVMALLVTGRPEEARRVHEALGPWVARSPNDLRTRLLDAWVSAGGGAGRR